MPSLKKSSPDPHSPLKYNTALRDLRSALRLIGVDPTGYGEHSGRRGGTTAAAAKGTSIDELMIQGRWRSCLLYTSPSPRDRQKSRMPSSA